MTEEMHGLRVLWLSPWLRPLARIHAEAIANAGAKVLLVTTDRHPSSDRARDYELVLDTRPKRLPTWPQFFRAYNQIRRFAPQVVVNEIVRDPRWLAFAPGVPCVQLVHDDRPHDPIEMKPRWERLLFGRWAGRSAASVAFSHHVAREIGASAVVPLTSDLDQTLVPPLVTAEERRNFVLIGRLHSYKNIEVCLQAWQKHTAGPYWCGDHLLLLGDGEWRGALPEHVVWAPGQFRYDDVVSVLAQAKASVVHYRRASQSGVQVLSLQLGVTPIVSTAGALPEFQPSSEAPIGIDDVDTLAEAFDSLANSNAAADRGAVCREHYDRHFSSSVAVRSLGQVLIAVARLPH